MDCSLGETGLFGNLLEGHALVFEVDEFLHILQLCEGVFLAEMVGLVAVVLEYEMGIVIHFLQLVDGDVICRARVFAGAELDGLGVAELGVL